MASRRLISYFYKIENHISHGESMISPEGKLINFDFTIEAEKEELALVA